MEQYYIRTYKGRSAGESKLLRLSETYKALQLPEFSWFNLPGLSGIQSKKTILQSIKQLIQFSYLLL